ncbi:MAG: hypothetical protein LH702_28710 [Phormidesmis sp. CAN_BIN44]|nr:hypothetical protein [Phormidesmis sp. CAN_BIN44]
MEGVAAAKPLIGTDIPGIRCAIQTLAADFELRSRLGQNARKRVELEFSREKVLKSLLEFYRQL